MVIEGLNSVIAISTYIQQNMRRTYSMILSVLLLLSILQGVSAFLKKGDPTIEEVSTSLNEFETATGSLEGGTIIYIKGTNFNPIAGNNAVWVGPYPCSLIADGATQSSLSCETTKATDPDRLSNLPISVEVDSKGTVVCASSNCKFSYKSARTPEILELFPRSLTGDEGLYISGIHRITDLGDGRSFSEGQIHNILIGETVCSMLDTLDEQEDELSADNRDEIYCKSFIHQQAGQYDFTEHVHPGYAKKSIRTQQTSLFTEQNYTLRVLPKITSMPYHEGSTEGHDMRITGTGFTTNLDDYTCKISNQDCEVIDAQESEITIRAPAVTGGFDDGALDADGSDPEAQTSPYQGVHGVKYQQFERDNWKSMDNWLIDIHDGTVSPTTTKVLTELSIPTGYDSNVVNYMSGYIHIPVDGVYRFASVCDDQCMLKLSQYKNNAAEANLQKILERTEHSTDYFNPYVRTNQSITSTNKTLTAGYYYFEFLHVDYGGGSFAKVMVDMEESIFSADIEGWINPTWQIDQILIQPSEYDAEVTIVDVYGTSGTFKLFYWTQYNGEYVKVESGAITVGESDSDFRSHIGSLSNYNNYSPSVSSVDIDANGAQTADPAAVKGKRYMIEIARYRDNQISLYNEVIDLVDADGNAGSVSVDHNSQPHSDPISGTFRINVNGQDIEYGGTADLAYNIASWKIADAISEVYEYAGEISVAQVLSTYREDQIHLIIEYTGIIVEPFPIQIDVTGLSGGNSNANIESTHTVLRQYSDRPLFNPLPYDFLYQSSATPTLEITVNSIPAVCDDCSYEYNAAVTPTISSASRVAERITIAITDNGSVGFVASDVTVTLMGVACTYASGDISSYVCDLPTNGDGSVALPAGSEKVKVHVKQVGYADDSGISAESIGLTVSSVSPSEVSPGGGAVVTISGAGLPASLDDQDTVTILLCDNEVSNYKVINNQEIQFVSPANSNDCGATATTISVNSISQDISSDITYNPSIAPTVDSLSKLSSSPIMKTTMTITGTGFGSTSNTFVYLYQDGEEKYELSTMTVSSTEITCILGGGKTGEYDVLVLVNGVGMSEAGADSKFNYKIVVTNVSPVSGSMGGGYTLTITGQNLAPSEGSNNVFVGEAMGSTCTILAASETEITCTMPPMDDTYNEGEAQEVVVTGRLLEESICEGSCSFTFDSSQTTEVILPSETEYTRGDTVTITGSGLTGATVEIDGSDCGATATDDTITFTYPELKAGDYEVIIEVGGARAYPPMTTSTPIEIWGMSKTSGSKNGHQISVPGNGFSEDSLVSVWFICDDADQLDKISLTPGKVEFEIPAFDGEHSSCKVNITTKEGVYKTYTYTYYDHQTPALQVQQLSSLSYQLTMTALSASQIDTVEFMLLDINGNPTSTKYAATIDSVSGDTIAVSVDYLGAGTYQVRAHSENYGFATATPSTVDISFPSTPTASATTSSFVGGKLLTISGAGFHTNSMENNIIRVCGLTAEVKGVSESEVVVAVPALVTETTDSLYGLAVEETVEGTAFSDTDGEGNDAFDGSFNTYYETDEENCYVGIDFGQDTVVSINSIRYAPNPHWGTAADYLEGGKFQVTNDPSSYTDLFDIDTSDVHSGWNYWKKEDGDSHLYRYVRFINDKESGCQLSELEVIGKKYSTQSVTNGVDKVCDVVVEAEAVTLSNIVTYDHDKTTIISDIDPQFGSITGGTTVTITGTNIGTVNEVNIDGIACTVSASTSTTITCETGERSAPPEEGNSMEIISDGSQAHIDCNHFLYVDRWSEEATWGGEAIPREGDSVYVPKGMTLLVDVSTPILDTVIVEGKIVFADEEDMTFDAYYFVINEGEFEAGTEDAPYQHKLTFTMHGGYYGKQLPHFGNKGIGCLNCKFNMHGQVRTPTWTMLESTISPGDVTFDVLVPVDWVAGEHIVIAGTGFDHYESEEMVIASVAANKTQITVESAFKYQHFAAVETYDGEDFVMRAEVGLLTRNIKMQGNEESISTKYGSHLLLMGREDAGLIGKISYSEFTHCGQPRIIGRYCTHFHMAGEVPESYVRGIAVHHSFARVLTIHGVHFLLVEKNVGYHVQGHNIFVEDGIETNNIIQDNLMISSISSFTLLQSDTSVASYWITNPKNTVRRNHAAGGDFYGIWYEIKEHPDGPSATKDICPMGMQLGESKDNVAHSNRRFGMRIFKHSARKFPCIDTQDESLLDPYSANPAIHSLYENFTLWKNEECGFLGEELGYATIKNFRTIDSRKGGMQFHKTNFTLQPVIAEDCLVVGYSSGNAPDDVDTDYEDARGIIASRTDGLIFSGLRFHNFGPTMTPLQSCSECYNKKVWVTGGKTTRFENITYTNIQGEYIFWEKWRREIFIDLDGSMSAPLASSLGMAAQSNATITPYRPSLLIENHCLDGRNQSWQDTIICDETIVLRGLLFTNAIPEIDFLSIDIKAFWLGDDIANTTVNATELDQDMFSSEPQIVIKKSMDIKHSWAMPFAMNQYYNIHWKWGIDFTHVAIAPSREWTDDDAVILRFNYTDERQLFQIAKWYQQKLQLPYIEKVANFTDLNLADCENGDYYQDVENYNLYVCVTGRNKTIREWIDVNGLRCLNFCPEEDPTQEREDFERKWSNATQWPNEQLPQEGDNVTIPFAWRITMDVDPPVLNYLLVNGILTFDQMRDNKLEAHYIWVKQGELNIGKENTPYIYNAEIILHGEKGDRYLVLDPDASGNKMLAATGKLGMYGTTPGTIWTRLTEIAEIGATTINVAAANDWNVGDKLVIAPSYANRTEFEEVQITEIDGTTITFDPALEYEHYGASSSTTASFQHGTLDARTAVGHLTRNIKIKGNEDEHGWGCRVFVYGYLETSSSAPPVVRNGQGIFDGVQFDGCSQYDSTYAALRFENLGELEQNEKASVVTKSSFHNCGGFCMFIDDVENLEINNNVFFWARKFLVYVEDVIDKYTFTNNLLVGARKRDEVDVTETKMVDDVACYEQYVAIDFPNIADLEIDVSDNLCQGAEGEGFVFPMSPCDLLDSYPFVDNTAGSCQVAFMYERYPDPQCIGATRMVGYASEIGLMANPTGAHIEIKYTKALFADNERGVTLRYAHETDDNTAFLEDSYIMGYSRPDCDSCYSSKTIKYCSGGYAIRMLATTISGEAFPLAKLPTGFDVICTRESYDFKAYLNNVVFENYYHTNTDVPYCSNMKVFKRHPIASDGTGGHYLTNTECRNCEEEAWAFFEKPNVGWRGWFGGCGELDCTGPNNYFIHDQDGAFTGSPSQILANNSVVAADPALNCREIPEINGHLCDTEDLVVLEYESIAPDFNLRIMWPIYLKYEGGSWESETNGWREWQWDGPEPMNRRLARFWSAVKRHENYNLTYSGTPPSDSRFQIQKRSLPTGNPDDWVIIRIYYPLPNSIEVLVKNIHGKDQMIRPFPIREGVAEDLTNHVDTCGANNFHFENGTIEFVVNGKDNCQVRVRLSSFIQLSVRLDIPIADFYTNDGETTFLTNICAFLGIDTGRMKIVGVDVGSTVVNATIQTENSDIDEATETEPDVQGEYDELTELQAKLDEEFSTGNTQINLGAAVLNYETSMKTYNIDGSEYIPSEDQGEEEPEGEEKDNLVLIIVLATVVPLLAITLGVGIYCYVKRKRARIETLEVEEIDPNDSEIHGGVGVTTDDFSLETKYKKNWRV